MAPLPKPSSLRLCLSRFPQRRARLLPNQIKCVDKTRMASSATSGGTETPGQAASQTISEVAQSEGGTTKGSQSATLQSAYTKQANLSTTSGDIADKLSTQGPGSITKDDARTLQSREDRAREAAASSGGLNVDPTPDATSQGGMNGCEHDSLTSQVQSLASANASEGGRGNNTSSSASGSGSGGTSAEQSQRTRNANLAETAEAVGTKLQQEPESISGEEAQRLHSREVKATGRAEKGGLASRAMSQAAENQGVTKNSNS